MPADFPDKFFNFRETENRPGVTFDENDKRRLFSEDIQKIAKEVSALNSLTYRSLGAVVNTDNFHDVSSPHLLTSFDVPFDLFSIEGARIHLTGFSAMASDTDGDVNLFYLINNELFASFSFPASEFLFISPVVDMIKSDDDNFIVYGSAISNANDLRTTVVADSVTISAPNINLSIFVTSDASDFLHLLSLTVYDYWRIPAISTI